MSVTVNPAIFKANDIRGIIDETLDAHIAYRIGLGIAQHLREVGQRGVYIGRDGRLSSPALSQALADGLCDGGIGVVDVGLVATPMLYYCAMKYEYPNCVMITGSHNPKNHNGMKIMVAGQVLGGDALGGVGENIIADRASPAPVRGDYRQFDCLEEYIADVVGAIGASGDEKTTDTAPLKIVVDAGNGAAGVVAPRLLRAIGCDVLELYCTVDGNFPNHHPDPANQRNHDDAKALARRENADVVFLFDGDGDRLGVSIGEQTLFPDYLLMFLARDYFRREHHGGARSIVYDVKCTMQLDAWIRRLGGEGVMVATGHSYIKAKMKEIGAKLGAEMSGHFYLGEFWYGFDDALLTAAYVASLLAAHKSTGQPIDAAFADIPRVVATPEVIIDTQGEDQHRMVAQLLQWAQAHPDMLQAARVITIDGLRAEYPNGFGLVRASNTTGSLVFRFEATTTQEMADIQDCFCRLLTACQSAQLAQRLKQQLAASAVHRE